MFDRISQRLPRLRIPDSDGSIRRSRQNPLSILAKLRRHGVVHSERNWGAVEAIPLGYSIHGIRKCLLFGFSLVGLNLLLLGKQSVLLHRLGQRQAGFRIPNARGVVPRTRDDSLPIETEPR